MYGHHGTSFPRATDPSQLVDWPAFSGPQPPMLPMLHQPQFEMEQVQQQLEGPVTANSGSTCGCCGGGGGYCSGYSSPSSLGSSGGSTSTKTTTHHQQQRPSLLQRSVSSHSLQKNGTHRVLSSVAELLMDSETSPVRRVYSTGDLQQRINMVQPSYRSSESPLSSESNAIIEGMSKACRYSPEEKKERIERYRSKRNQRNFNKKIKYACRKTLADSRPRIRGRFARNEEITEKNSDDQLAQWSHINGIGEEEYEDDDENWVNLLDAFSSNLIP
ncbi:CCT domain containing protein [Parasponia andersonii]|uniref:CCT domain containing protein n=1 Tax=Parasponia andersonii TaxID=3476 RepID=A0A2P5A841_PARAD|nr:CCT domain containing protein [Parasponia andersonii]